jgi:hypothetical protein
MAAVESSGAEVPPIVERKPPESPPGCLDRLRCGAFKSWFGWWLQLTFSGTQIQPTAFAERLAIAHFNDVYNVEQSKKKAVGSAARFVAALKRFHDEASAPAVCFFSGDCFNPSIMSTVVKGAQMPLVLNAAQVRCAVVGNHDFDHGPERLTELIAKVRDSARLDSTRLDSTRLDPTWLGLTCAFAPPPPPRAVPLPVAVLQRDPGHRPTRRHRLCAACARATAVRCADGRRVRVGARTRERPRCAACRSWAAASLLPHGY